MACYDTIKLEKGMYHSDTGFTQILEALDPSAHYEGTALEGLDAYERQLKRFDIHVSGGNSDQVEKFFKNSDATVLFPEYVSRAVYQGMEEANMLPNIIATTTKINGLDYRTIASIADEEDKELKEVGETACIPQTTVKTQNNLVRLHKRGRTLAASYEAIRLQRLDLFTVTLKQIGAYISRSLLKDVVDVLINGDGNNNAADSINAATAGTLTYSDLVGLWNSLYPYELNTMIASSDSIIKLLNLNEFKDAGAGLDFHGSGKLVTPIGSTLIKSVTMPAGKIIGLDKTCSIEMIQSGEILTESDKLIDRQLGRTAISIIAGFAKIFKNSSKVLSI